MDARMETESRATRVPACSVEESGGTVMVKLEMPGVAKDKLELRIEGNELSVTGEPERGQPQGRFLIRERRVSPYRKLFTLDDTIDREGIEASLADGILTLKLKLKEAAKPRRIEIA